MSVPKNLIFVLVIAAVLIAGIIFLRPFSRGADSATLDAAGVEMNAGLAAQAKDPAGAAAHFRKVLELSPKHYGATFQLARSLDLEGKPAEAKPYWEQVIVLADAIKDKPSGDIARARLAGGSTQLTGHETDEELMKLGVDALYTRRDPINAVTLFRALVQRTPSHYGANFQLATALDGANSPAEALAQWKVVLGLATAINDAKTIETATTRIAALGRAATAPGTPAPVAADPEADAAMKAGLDAVYTKHDPAAGVVEFRKVIARNPEHYGANYQLAMALDQAGQATEARPQWENVLRLADRIHDATVIEAARTRLAKR